MDDATSAVSAGRVDLAFGVDYPQAPIPRARDVALLVLGTERFAMATAADRAAREGPASLRDFADEPWMRRRSRAPTAAPCAWPVAGWTSSPASTTS